MALIFVVCFTIVLLDVSVVIVDGQCRSDGTLLCEILESTVSTHQAAAPCRNALVARWLQDPALSSESGDRVIDTARRRVQQLHLGVPSSFDRHQQMLRQRFADQSYGTGDNIQQNLWVVAFSCQVLRDLVVWIRASLDYGSSAEDSVVEGRVESCLQTLQQRIDALINVVKREMGDRHKAGNAVDVPTTSEVAAHSDELYRDLQAVNRLSRDVMVTTATVDYLLVVEREVVWPWLFPLHTRWVPQNIFLRDILFDEIPLARDTVDDLKSVLFEKLFKLHKDYPLYQVGQRRLSEIQVRIDGLIEFLQAIDAPPNSDFTILNIPLRRGPNKDWDAGQPMGRILINFIKDMKIYVKLVSIFKAQTSKFDTIIRWRVNVFEVVELAGPHMDTLMVDLGHVISKLERDVKRISPELYPFISEGEVNERIASVRQQYLDLQEHHVIYKDLLLAELIDEYLLYIKEKVIGWVGTGLIDQPGSGK